MNEKILRRQIEILKLERDEWRKGAEQLEFSRDQWRKLYEQTLTIAVQAANHEYRGPAEANHWGAVEALQNAGL